MGKLTDALILAAPHGLLNDGDRLRLFCTPTRRTWQLKYRDAAGTDRTKTLGNYNPGNPDHVSINKARALAEDVRAGAKLAAPEATPAKRTKPTELTFRAVGEAYMAWAPGRKGKSASAGTLKKRSWAFDKLRGLHGKLLHEIDKEDLKPLLQAIRDEAGASAGAYTARLISSIFDYAEEEHGRPGAPIYNPAARRKTWGLTYRAEHHPGITDPKAFGQLAYWVDKWWEGTVANATRFLMRTAVRMIELRGARWSEFHDLNNPALARWEIPAARMKMGEAHTVPLSAGAVAILEAQRLIVPQHSEFVWPNGRVPGDYMSKSAVGNYLEACGYDSSQQTPHGFRTSFTTLATEAGKSKAMVNVCLAHAEKDAVWDSYNRAAQMDARRGLMNWWDAHIEELKAAV